MRQMGIIPAYADRICCSPPTEYGEPLKPLYGQGKQILSDVSRSLLFRSWGEDPPTPHPTPPLRLGWGGGGQDGGDVRGPIKLTLKVSIELVIGNCHRGLLAIRVYILIYIISSVVIYVICHLGWSAGIVGWTNKCCKFWLVCLGYQLDQ